jgi:flagellar motor switch/type III secretory pathway protein FliN
VTEITIEPSQTVTEITIEPSQTVTEITIEPSQTVTEITIEPSQTVTDIASNVQLILYCYKMLQENLIGWGEGVQAILSLL